MKSLIICTRDLEYGVGSVVKYELKKLDQDKNISKIILIGPKRLDGYSSKVIFEIIPNKGRFFITKEPNFAFKCNKKIKEILSRERIDEIYLHFPINTEKFGVRIVSKFHSLHKSIIKNQPKNLKFFIGYLFHRIYSYFDKITIVNSNKVMFVSKKTLDQAKKLYPDFEKKFVHSPNNIDSSKFYKLNNEEIVKLKKLMGFADDKINLLFIGRLEPMKGIMNLVRVLKDLNSSKFRLLVIGDGPLSETVKKYSFVKYLGKIPNEELYKYYNLADVFVLPSLYENAPMTLLEARACKTKILASNVGDNSLLLRKQDIFNNEKELKDKLSLMIK